MGLKISRCTRHAPRWAAGLMRRELNRREAEWRVSERGRQIDRHDRAKPLGCLLVEARLAVIDPPKWPAILIAEEPG